MRHNDRVGLFISHANPEDNAFTLWLGAKLNALGYEVWADVMRVRGGDDWQRELEDALRYRTRKVLFVGTPNGAEKQGPRNEIQIAHNVGRQLEDDKFIIPLRLAPFNAPFLIAHAHYIDFQFDWAQGLLELLDILDQNKIPRSLGKGNGVWREIQIVNGRSVEHKPETLRSNWLEISTIPKVIRFYDLYLRPSAMHR